MSSWLLDLFDGDLDVDSDASLVDLKNALFASEQRDIIELGMSACVISVSLCIYSVL